MRHADKAGAGYKKRKHLRGKAKAAVVMREFHRGTLHLPKKQGGGVVTGEKQAKAIAMSEAGLSKGKKRRAWRYHG